jgi:hypothetical protein
MPHIGVELYDVEIAAPKSSPVVFGLRVLYFLTDIFVELASEIILPSLLLLRLVWLGRPGRAGAVCMNYGEVIKNGCDNPSVVVHCGHVGAVKSDGHGVWFDLGQERSPV